jgi:hypothetical protein
MLHAHTVPLNAQGAELGLHTNGGGWLAGLELRNSIGCAIQDQLGGLKL